MTGASRTQRRLFVWSTVGTFALIALAMALPRLIDWDVHVRGFPPIHAVWDPRFGATIIVAAILAVLVVLFGQRVAERLRWGWLLLAAYGAGLVWLLSLALIDGNGGIGTILNHPYEYLPTAREITDFGATLQEYVSRIPAGQEDKWPVHLAGHPPGALLFFWVLVQIGLGSGLAAGLVVTVIGASTPLAVAGTLRALGAETLARKALPFLVLTPAALWITVSADGMFAAVGAWGMWALARATRAWRERDHERAGAWRMTAWSILAGLLLGYAVMLSYGLPLLGLLALAVLVAGRAWWPLPIAAAAALAVVLVFAVYGFAWWEAFPVLRERYWDGIASDRPGTYWTWGDLAAFALSAGPMVGASLVAAVHGLKRSDTFTAQDTRASEQRTLVLLALAGWAIVLIADLSQMSRAEVERIWLPFVPWALLGLALYSKRLGQIALVIQAATAIVLQCLVDSGW